MFQNFMKKHPLFYSYTGMQLISFGLCHVFGLWLGSKNYLRYSSVPLVGTIDSATIQSDLYISDYLDVILWSAYVAGIIIAVLYLYLNRIYLRMHYLRLLGYTFLLVWYSLYFFLSKMYLLFLNIGLLPNFRRNSVTNNLIDMFEFGALAWYIFSIYVVDIYSSLYAHLFHSELFIPFTLFGNSHVGGMSLSEVLWPTSLIAIPPVVLGLYLICKYCKSRTV